MTDKGYMGKRGRPGKSAASMPNRIREHREAAGMLQRDLADALGEKHGETIRKLEDGTTALSTEWRRRIARALNVAPLDLLSEVDVNAVTIPIQGIIVTGGLVQAVGESDIAGRVEPPDGDLDLRAIEVRGAAMLPRFRSGEVLFYLPSDRVEPDTIGSGHECIVQVRGGPMLVRTVFSGTAPGLYRVRAVNGEEEELALEWATHVLYVRFVR